MPVTKSKRLKRQRQRKRAELRDRYQEALVTGQGLHSLREECEAHGVNWKKIEKGKR